jgi:acetyltransferase-like isoleucine patch superfamily enzyme
VFRDVPAWTVNVGSPARPIRTRVIGEQAAVSA